MGKNTFTWTADMIKYEELYDEYCGNILNGTRIEYYLNLLRQVADTEDYSRNAGYAASLLYMLYDGDCQTSVPKNTELHKKYLDISCKLNETDALLDRIAEREDMTCDEEDKYYKELLSGNCNRPHSVWTYRAILRRFSSRNGWEKPNVIKNFFLRRYFLFKAWTTLPKHKHFDHERKINRDKFLKSLIPMGLILIAIILILLLVIAA